MQTADELRAQLGELQQANQAIMAAAENQNRDLSIDESRQFDDNSVQFDAAQRHLERIEAMDRQHIVVTTPQPRRAQPHAGQLRQQNGIGATGRGFGAMVTSNADFRAWHNTEGWRRRRGLNFEIMAASTWPAESDMGVLMPGIGGGPSWADTGVLRSLIPKSPGGGPAITTVRETAEDMAAAYQADYGTVKKESTVTMSPVTLPTVTIAHYCRVPDQLVEDLAGFVAFIEQRLRLGLIRKEETELLAGTGATTGFGTLQGLLPVATEVTPPTGTGVNAADHVQAAIVAVQANGFSPDAIVCSPAFWASVGGLKSTTGTYLIPALPSAAAPVTLWGLRVYISSAMTGLADFLVGDFANGSRLFVAKNAVIDISLHDATNFTTNQVTIRAELREAHVVYNGKAYIKQTGTGTLSASAQQERKAK